MSKPELIQRLQKMIDQNLEMIENNNKVLGHMETTRTRILPVEDSENVQ